MNKQPYFIAISLTCLVAVLCLNLSPANAARAKELIHVGSGTPDDLIPAAELAAWTMVANLILNLDETITKG